MAGCGGTFQRDAAVIHSILLTDMLELDCNGVLSEAKRLLGKKIMLLSSNLFARHIFAEINVPNVA